MTRSQLRLVASPTPIAFADPKIPLYPRLSHGKSLDTIAFADPKIPLYPRLSHGKSSDTLSFNLYLKTVVVCSNDKYKKINYKILLISLQY
jgi:hypothetical protein